MKIDRVLFSCLLVILINSLVYSLTIKIGSVAPARSPWDKALRELGREWKRITEGAVLLKIYPGGIAGNEGDMIRKMRFGTLGGAVLTNRGITRIYSDAYVLNIPFLLNSEAEMKYLLEKMTPFFEKELEKKGFKVIIWSSAGWLNFFSKNPIYYPEDLKKHKLSFAIDAPKMEQAWKKSGYHMVPNDLNDLMMALQTGMVDACCLSPIIAGFGQYFPLAPNMCSLKIAPIVGVIVISLSIWKKISDKFKEAMLAYTKKLSEDLYKKIVELEKETISAMQENGLKLNKAPVDALEKWRMVSQKGMDILVGKVFSQEIHAKLLSHLNEYRKIDEN